ncbi:hypothetical protein SteCoe_27891 [Stentor coeruleus]|uniref:Condensin complex subunit 1 C-terminal domain-containing protein n=1 Tax=Stentor coeruleus TaxID=5963 RepID=A0A1R2B9E2_9CILI|nr:hypothetical protein SteCoe_27891 [Stentor coeruleus]
MEEDTKNLHPVEVLIEELKSEEVNRRVISVKTLNTIAIALGPKLTREELLPYLLELLDDENEVLLALAESLRYLIQSIGGRKYAYVLFDLIEQLLQIDESNIRTTTLESFKQILKQARSPYLAKAVLDLIKRLCTSDKVPAKIAAAFLIPNSLENVKDIKPYIDQFKSLMLCNHPQVRNAAGENLKALVKYEEFAAELLNIATVDQEDSVRLLALEALLICNNVKGLITSVTALFEDDYWKVKQKIAENLASISRFLCGKYDLMLDYFKRIVDDKEIDVRTALCNNISEVFKVVPNNMVEKFLIVLPVLGNDTLQIRIALAQQINKIWPVTGKNQVLSMLIKDLTSTYSSQISLNLIEDIHNMRDLYEDFENTMKSQFELLSKDKSWRVRQNFLNHFPYLVEKLGSGFFLANLKDIFIDLTVDPAFTVRETSSIVIIEIIKNLGKDWFEKEIVNELFNLQHSKNYICRMSYLNLAKEIFKEFIGSKTEERFEKSIFFLLGDVVANVRAYALKALHVVYQCGSLDKQQMIKNSLSILQQDEDSEVRNLALEMF